MEKIHISFMKDLRNIEFGELFDIVTTIVAAENIGLPTLTMACEQLQPHTHELMKMNNQKIKHPLTPIIGEQVKTRTEYLTALRMVVDAKMMWHKPEERVAAERLQFWLKTYKDDIFAPTISTQSRMVENLMADWKEDAAIKSATALLDLDELLVEIVKLTATIRQNQLTRLNDKDIYEVDGQSIRKAAYKDLKVLVSVIDSSYNIGANEEQREQLASLSKSLNASLQDFHTILKSRNTKRKNKKENAAAVKELIDSELKDSKQELENNNLPVVVYDELKISGTYEAPASYISRHTGNGTSSTLSSGTKDKTNDEKTNTKKGANKSSNTKNDKDKSMIGGDRGLPPISMN